MIFFRKFPPLVLVACFETTYRGGTIFSKRLYNSLVFSGAPFSSYFFALSRSSFLQLLLFLFRSFFADVLIISFPASIPFSFLFFWKRKYCIMHTPYDRFSLHTKFFFVLHGLLVFRAKYLFVAHHLAVSYRQVLQQFNLELLPAFVIYPLLRDVSSVDEVSPLLNIPIDPHCLHLVFTGGSSPEKNLEFALEVYGAFRALRSVRFHLFGKIFSSVSDQLHGDPHIFQYGFVPLPWRRYASCSSFHLMPSAYEGMPLSCVEAMSYGIPTLGSQISAFSELSSLSPHLVRQLPLECSLWASTILEMSNSPSVCLDANSYDVISRRCFESFAADVLPPSV